MECSCTVGDGVDDKVDLLSGRFIKARKEHTCFECNRLIRKGEEYFREAWVYEGSVSTHKTCEDCYSLRQVFFSNGWYYGQLIEDMYDFVGDCGGEVSIPCMLQLTTRARGIVCDMIEDTWGDEDECTTCAECSG